MSAPQESFPATTYVTEKYIDPIHIFGHTIVRTT